MLNTVVEMTEIEKIRAILKHITNVEKHCVVLAYALYKDDPELGKTLFIRSRQHDLSKLLNKVELNGLWSEHPKFEQALSSHHKHNRHHPEYFTSIDYMEDADLAEMVCDCVARGQEFGTDVRQWFEKEATKKYKFKMKDEIGQKIAKYLDILLKPSFKRKETGNSDTS